MYLRDIDKDRQDKYGGGGIRRHNSRCLRFIMFKR